MSNFDPIRDCQHGRQKGKCDSCDLEQAEKIIEQQQQRITELEAQLGKVNNKCVVYDLEPAQHESAIRDHLIKLGWTPPKGE